MSHEGAAASMWSTRALTAAASWLQRRRAARVRCADAGRSRCTRAAASCQALLPQEGVQLLSRTRSLAYRYRCAAAACCSRLPVALAGAARARNAAAQRSLGEALASSCSYPLPSAGQFYWFSELSSERRWLSLRSVPLSDLWIENTSSILCKSSNTVGSSYRRLGWMSGLE